jgi:hypothetical protein
VERDELINYINEAEQSEAANPESRGKLGASVWILGSSASGGRPRMTNGHFDGTTSE